MSIESGRRRLAINLLDQAVSSGTNFVMLLLVIRIASLPAVGAFMLAYYAFFLILALCRGSCGETFTIVYSHESKEIQRRQLGRCTGAVVLLGVTAAFICACVATALQGDTRSLFLLLAIGLPGLLLQDTWRIAAFASGRPASALHNDVLMSVIQLAVYGLLLASNAASAHTLLAGWILAAYIAAGFGARQFRCYPAVREAKSWMSQHRDLSVPLAMDYGFNRGAEQLVLIGVSAAGSLAIQGALSTTRSLFAPLTTVQSGINSFVLPEISRAHQRGDGRHVRLLTRRVALGTAFLMAAAGGLLVVLPESWGMALLGDNWGDASDLFIPMTVFSMINAATFGMWIGARACGGAVQTMRARAIFGVILVVLATTGASHGAAASIWGMSIGTAGLLLTLTRFVHRLTANSPN